MSMVYVLFGIKYPYKDSAMGEMPGRKENLSVHETWDGLMKAIKEALNEVERCKDPATKSWTRNWDFDQIFFDTIQLEK